MYSKMSSRSSEAKRRSMTWGAESSGTAASRSAGWGVGDNPCLALVTKSLSPQRAQRNTKDRRNLSSGKTWIIRVHSVSRQFGRLRANCEPLKRTGGIPRAAQNDKVEES